ncbi:MAG: UDP-3-O-acyl-N-acetylglucosamine deacetylase [bacterium]|nr:UDP-3-O-acyl-N-acetylglucosamine deacetylase [bacterium]
MGRQATIRESAVVSGLGLHTGRITTLRFLPAEVNTGVRFVRADLPGRPRVPARVSAVVDTQRSTTLGVGRAVVQTVEHILAAVQCLGLDNVEIEVQGPETPLTDGSSRQFIEALEGAGRVEQDAEQEYVELPHAVAVEQNGMTLCAIPAEEYRVSYTMLYSHPVIGLQFKEVVVSREVFVEEIGSARTFALYSELEQLLKAGLIKGGSLDNAIVITDQAILSKDGLRYPDEFVRHKIMDLIGDLALIGRRLRAHVVSIRSGHALNVRLARAICETCGIG